MHWLADIILKGKAPLNRKDKVRYYVEQGIKLGYYMAYMEYINNRHEIR